MHFVQASLLTLFCASASIVYAETTSTAQILHRTLTAAPACLNWRWIGNCLWLKCHLLGCDVETSPKVHHYLPDLLVTVHRTPADQPWIEMRHVLNVPQTTALKNFGRAIFSNRYVGSGGDVSVSTDHAGNADVRFFEANVFGHPLADLTIDTDQLFCQSVTRAGKPYYQSALDALAWRMAPLESVLPVALVPGQREIGTSAMQSWGAVYPRSGFVTQQDPVKAAAVIAQRACDIVIGPRRLHVALALEAPVPYTTVPIRLDERDVATGMWQMISPKIDTRCELFGSDDPSWQLGRIDASRAFVWNLWRSYECCEPRGEKYLGAVHF